VNAELLHARYARKQGDARREAASRAYRLTPTLPALALLLAVRLLSELHSGLLSRRPCGAAN
jgi:hypothetical protein